MADTDFINFTIDGHQGRALKGTLLIVAAERMGIYIPRFCHHEKLKPYAGCRQCLVEIEGVPKLQTACSIEVREGMIVHTDTDKVKKAQKAVLEFILINHPLDCPICDKGGECPLQDQYYKFSSSLSRFTEKKLFSPHAPLNSTIEQDFNRCVKCKRCVRYTYEVATDDMIIYKKRGVHTQVTSFDRQNYESAYSGNIIELCPVGALTDNVYRFRCRPWELKHKASICANCTQNCHVDLQYRTGELMRIFSRSFEPVNDCWLCDKGRFHHQYLKSPERIRQPLEKVDGVWTAVTWKRAFELIIKNINKTLEEFGTGAIAGIIENDHTLEELSAFRKLMWDVIKTPNFDSHPSMKGIRSEKNDYFVKNLPTFSQVASSKAVLNLGCDLVSEAPLLAIKMRENMLGQGMKPFNLMTFPTETSKLMPEIIIPLDQYAGVLAAIIRKLSADDRLHAKIREQIINSVKDIKKPSDPGLEATVDTISEMILKSKISLVIGRSILKRNSVFLSLAKILIEMFERFQAIPVIMPMLEGANAAGAEFLKVHPMLPSGGAGGEMELSGGQDAEEIIRNAVHGRIKTLLVFSHRFGINHTRYEWDRGMEKIDFIVWADYFHSPLNDVANLLLPLQSPYEKNGHMLNNEGRFDKLSSAIRVRGDMIPTLEILSKLAIGFGHDTGFDPGGLIAEIKADSRFGENLDLGGFVYSDVERDYLLKAAGLADPNLAEQTSAYPFILLTHQPFWYGDSTMLNSPDLLPRLPDFECLMNDRDAVEKKLTPGKTIEVSSEHGSIKAVLRTDVNMPRGYVVMPEGYVQSRLGVLTLSGKEYIRVNVGQVFSE